MPTNTRRDRWHVARAIQRPVPHMGEAGRGRWAPPKSRIPNLRSGSGSLTREDSVDMKQSPQQTGPVLLVSTQGGHLAHLLALRTWWEGQDRLWVCPDTPDVVDRLDGERVVRSYSPTTRNLLNLVRNSVLALRLLRRERPSLVVSAGAGVAVPFFVAAWLLRIPTVFIEVYDRVDTPTMTGRLCGPFTTRRHRPVAEPAGLLPDAHLVGPLL